MKASEVKKLQELGVKLTMSLAIKAKCWDCMGYYDDGKVDCENFGCPLYNWMPNAEYEPILNWMRFNPRRVGKVTWVESKRKMTEEQRKALADRMRKLHKQQDKKGDKKR